MFVYDIKFKCLKEDPILHGRTYNLRSISISIFLISTADILTKLKNNRSHKVLNCNSISQKIPIPTIIILISKIRSISQI